MKFSRGASEIDFFERADLDTTRAILRASEIEGDGALNLYESEGDRAILNQRPEPGPQCTDRFETSLHTREKGKRAGGGDFRDKKLKIRTLRKL